MTTFNLPDLGEGLQEAEIVAWHVGEGDHVVADQPLVSVETDKAVVDVPSPRAGRIDRLFGQPGDIVNVGAPLVAFADTKEVDRGRIVGELEATDEVVAEAPTEDSPGAAVAVKATPAVRAQARRLGVDLAVVSPSGPDGAITAADLERAAHALAEAGPLELMRGVRRAMAKRMAQAHAEVVPATVVEDADVEAWPDGEDVTLRLIRAIVAGCQAEPSLNAWYDSPAGGRRLHGKIDLGIAVDTVDGLFVPVLRDISGRSGTDLRRGLERMKADVKARTIPPEELRGATITLSNFGTVAGRYAAPVVVPPQVAILSAGRIAPRVVAAQGKPAVHRTLPVSLTFDHRAVTGGEAARFLAAVVADLESPG
ncbi:MAG: dihydrolipoamide acetyltransferase family protein [Kiloniellaceae bacterium]